MATVGDMSPDQLVSAIKEGNKDLISQLGLKSSSGGSSFGGGGGGGGGSGFSMPGFSSLSGVTDSLITNFGKLAQGSMSAGEALGAFTGVIAKAVPGFGDVFKSLADGVYEQGNIFNESLKDASKSGAYWGNDLGKYGEQVTGARMTLSEMNEAVKKNGSSMNQLGLNMDQSMTRYAKMAKDLQETDIAAVLQRTGMTAEEFNSMLQDNVANRKMIDFNDEKARKGTIDSTIALATEMDDLARLTGKSRDQQREDLKKQTSDAQSQAMLRQMSAEQQSSYLQTQTELGAFGEDVQSLGKEIATGGVRTKEGAEKLAAMGPAAASFQEAMKLRTSTDPADRARSDAAMKQFKDELMAYQKSSAFLDQVRLGAGPVSEAMGRQMIGNVAMGPGVAAEHEAEATGKSVDEIAAMEAKAKKESRLGITPEGAPAEGVQTARAMNEANRAMKDISAGVGSTFKGLNDEGGKLLQTIKGYNDLFSVRKQEDVAKTIKSPVTAVTDMVSSPIPWKHRKNGTLGSTGQFMEDFGSETPALLHGKEGVITEEQFKGLADYFTKSTSKLGINTNDKEKTPIENTIEPKGFMDQITASFENIGKNVGITAENPVTGMMDQISKMFNTSKSDIDAIVNDITSSSKRTEEGLQQLTSQQTSVASDVGQTSPTIADLEKIFTQVNVSPAESTPSEVASAEPKVETTSMTDLKEELVQLNKSIKELITHTHTVADNVNMQTRVTKSLSGNRLG